MFSRLTFFILTLCLLFATACGGCDETGSSTTGSDDAGGADSGADGGIERGCHDDDGDGFLAGPDCRDVKQDCNDDATDVNPETGEVCGDGIDNDCDGSVDEGCDGCTDGETRECGKSEGACEIGTQTCEAGRWSECEGQVAATAETCNGIDDDCDGVVDENAQMLCDDGIFCNGEETCEMGQCVSETGPVDCSDLSGPCQEGTCSEKDRGCVVYDKPDGETCDDGSFCTVDNVCQDGVCEGSSRDCSSAGDQCNDGVCDEEADSCVAQPVSDGTTCDDGEFCTVGDTCTAGACGGSARDCSSATDQCNVGICDENADACVGDPRMDGTVCDDGQYCTVDDTCQAGTCTPGPARECGVAGGSCRTGTCDESLDQCTGDPVPDGTGCDDNQYCTVSDSCQAGTCMGQAPRDCSSAGDQCNDGVCNEMANTCEPDPKQDGTTCDDGLFCTSSDQCTSGSCGGSPTDCSSAGDACNVGICDENSDACVQQPKSDGTACDDGEWCTINDMCQSGVCERDQRDCTGTGDQCNDGVCDDSVDKCVKDPVMDGTTCDDGQFCTTGDVCTAGSCGGPGTYDCSMLDDQCNIGVCDEATGGCVKQPRADGTMCDDGVACTVSDVCTAGSCGGSPMDCSSLDDPASCAVGVCDESTGSCTTEAAADGSSCDDGDSCTTGDVCSSGTCGGTAVDCSSLTDLDSCLVGVCDPTDGSCTTEAASDGTSCDDGNLCTTNDTCSSGTCMGTGVDCSGSDDPDNCLVGVCDPATGSCTTEAASDGTTCNDGDLCTTNDVCSGGTCTSDPVDCSSLDNQDACLVGVCDPSDGSCTTTAAADGTTCNDGDLCTTNDVCSSGTCTSDPVDCSSLDDQDACLVGVCDPSDGSCTTEAAADGTTCNDGDLCTTNDVCSSGTCTSDPVDCSSFDNQDACLVGVCDPSDGSCTTEAASDGTTCDDGDLCTTNDVCSGGTCTSDPVDCSGLDDQDKCLVGVCDPSDGSCTTEAAADGTTCNDGSWCTENDTCTGGVCDGTARDCSVDPSDFCNTGRCDETLDQCVKDPEPDGTLCNDGKYCTKEERCQSGTCVGVTPRDCSTTNDCTIGSCDETAKKCVEDPAPSGEPCEDGLVCTVNDTCDGSGTCDSGSQMDCSAYDGGQCEEGVCDESAGGCITQNLPDGDPCDDSLFCTENDECSSGTCTGTAVDCSHLNEECKTGVCEETAGGCTTNYWPDGDPCNDGLYCTDPDTCTSGTCSGPQLDCSGVTDDPCYDGVCDDTNDECTAVDNGTCDPCTTGTPTADAGGDQFVTPNTTVSLDGTNSSDPDGQTLSYSWRIASQPSGSTATLSGADTATPTLLADVSGTFEVCLTVTDTDGCSSAEDCMTITVTPDADIHIELVWFSDDSDVDVHYQTPPYDQTEWFDAYKIKGGGYDPASCGRTGPSADTGPDCFWCVPNPDWGGGPPLWHADGIAGNDPILDVDNVDGYGPENINQNDLFDGDPFTVGIHYYHNTGALGDSTAPITGDVSARVRIFSAGALLFETTKTLSCRDFWEPAQVSVSGGGTTVTVSNRSNTFVADEGLCRCTKDSDCPSGETCQSSSIGDICQ